ncbi:hypothetical protein RHSIM_Rhsim01G0052800 [Rhododendron simsii]|uniref:Uncharacterized protein n=1 Tax=Rhododendron simsii TaxID=118357 RepID=A0A834HI35_RHOSS|nr:hypothetical protein RHSIM_Rhsim01G0052800 [Rhododendron simsii]
MGGCSVRPRLPPRILPGPADIARIILEEVVRAIIEDIRRRIEQQNGSLHLIYAKTSNCELPGGVMGLKSFNNEAMSTEEAVLKLLDRIPPEYADQLQNPEEMVKRLNIDVPPECMPEVAAVLAKHYNQRHLSNTSPSLRNKLKQTLCLSYCFPNNNNDHHHRREALENKCRNLINRIGRHLQRRRHCSMADFKYDPLSYALNFDEGGFNEDCKRLAKAAPRRKFSTRVSALPPLKTAAKAGITCL